MYQLDVILRLNKASFSKKKGFMLEKLQDHRLTFSSLAVPPSVLELLQILDGWMEKREEPGKSNPKPNKDNNN